VGRREGWVRATSYAPCRSRRKQPPARSPWRVDPTARREGSHACCTGRDVLAAATAAEPPFVLLVVGRVGQWPGSRHEACRRSA
jgi:hypothetical protein